LGGAYRIARLIGRGGMGAVYEAAHLRLPKRFAVKFLQRDLPKDKEAFARFQREAEIASSLGNRHIAEVVDFNTMPDGSPYMIMEYLEGEDLSTRLRTSGRIALDRAADICGQIASGLGAAHKRGIVHRDLKPENIYLCTSDDGMDFVKLLDFGISKIRGAQKTITGDMMMLGTPAYMSPEQARGDVKNIDERTDVYALGAVMFETLSGRPAFDGESVYAILMKIANEMPPSLSEYAPELPAEVEVVIRRALAKDPAQRIANVGEFWKEFKEAAHAPSRPIVTLSPTLDEAQRTAPTVRPRAKSTAPIATQPTVARRTQSTLSSGAAEVIERDLAETINRPKKRGAMIGLGLGLGAAVIAVLAFANKKKETPAPTPAVTPIAAPAPEKAKPVEPTPPAAPKQVTIKLTGLPEGAELALDGKPAQNPLVLSRSTEHHQLSVSAPGFVARDMELLADADHSVDATLRRAPVEKTPKHKPAEKTPKKKKPSLVGGSDL
jgi:serine/threonine-protein kinase